MALVNDLLAVLPMASAVLWLGIGVTLLARRRIASPFEKAIAAVALLLGTWALIDWFFLGLDATTEQSLAIAVSNVRSTIITLAMVPLLLASKWAYVGHHRYDALLILPVLGSLAIIWSGMTVDVVQASWGPRLIRDQPRYILWAAQQVAYMGTAIAFGLALYIQQRDLAKRLRRRILWTAGSLLVLMAAWLATNIYNNVTLTAGVPWFSSLLVIPAAIMAVALVPLNEDEWGEIFTGLYAVPERVLAAYLFYRTGEPLVALSASHSFPIEAEQLEGVLAVVGNFVETSVASGRTYDITAMRYESLGILSVRGQYVIAAAIYDGRAYDALRSNLVRIVKRLEERHREDLQSWEQATRAAETVADELSALLYRKPVARPETSKRRAEEAQSRNPADGTLEHP